MQNSQQNALEWFKRVSVTFRTASGASRASLTFDTAFRERHFMFASRSNHYVPLLEKAQIDRDDCGSSEDLVPPTPCFDEKQRKPRTIPWTLVLVVACTLLNVALTVLPMLRKEAPQDDMVITRQNIHLLPRPNQYIGFDEIQRPSPPVSRQLTSYPILLSLIDAASPSTVFDDDFAAYMVHGGTITPDDRKVRITPTMSTIIQFRAIDWGMEICELHIDLPESFGQAGHSGSLALHRINATIPLDSAVLSHDTRPPRVTKVAVIQLGNGAVTWHRRFNCATDEVLTFELSCVPFSESGGDSNCLVEWIQIKNAVPAIYMVQHATM